MATIPDTLEIARELDSVLFSDVVDFDRARRASDRLRALHALGATEELTLSGIRAERDALRAELNARPTVKEHSAALDRIKDLTAQLSAIQNPPLPFSVPVGVFRGKLIPLRLALIGAPEDVRAVWAVLLPELDHLTAVYPREEPVAGLLALAVEHKLLTAAQVADIRGE